MGRKKRPEGLWFRPDTRFIWIVRTDPRTKKQLRYTSKMTIEEHARKKYIEDSHQAEENKDKSPETLWTIAELLDWAFKTFWMQKKKFNSYNYKALVKTPLLTFGEITANILTKKQVLDYINKRRGDKVKDSTISRELVPFRSAYQFANDTDNMLSHNPFLKLPLEAGEQRNRSASAEEKKMFLDSTAGLMNDVLEFDFWTGLRAGQLRALKWADIDFIRKRVNTCSWKGEGKKVHYYWVELFPAALKVLLRRPRISDYVFCNELGEPIPEEGLLSNFPRITERLRIVDFHFHDIRHTFATDYYNGLLIPGRKYDIVGLKNMLGHKSVKTTEIYINLTEQDSREYNTVSITFENSEIEETTKIADIQTCAVSSVG